MVRLRWRICLRWRPNRAYGGLRGFPAAVVNAARDSGPQRAMTARTIASPARTRSDGRIGPRRLRPAPAWSRRRIRHMDEDGEAGRRACRPLRARASRRSCRHRGRRRVTGGHRPRRPWRRRAGDASARGRADRGRRFRGDVAVSSGFAADVGIASSRLAISRHRLDPHARRAPATPNITRTRRAVRAIRVGSSRSTAT